MGRLALRMACIPSVEHLPGASSGQESCSLRIELVKAELVRPRNGRFPNSSSYARMPSDQKSTGAEYPRFVKTSGAGPLAYGFHGAYPCKPCCPRLLLTTGVLKSGLQC